MRCSLAVWVAAGTVIAGGRPLAAQEAPASPVQSTAGEPRVGYTPADAGAELSVELKAITVPSPAQSDSFSHFLSYQPHMAGTPAQARTRDFVLEQFKKWGLETETRTYDVYMPQPKLIQVWRFGTHGDSSQLSLPEGPIPGDPTSSAFPQIPTFNAYSGIGSGAGEVVYVNYGLIEDYAHLDSVGVSVKGKVVIARYGRSFRGIKAREAEKHGAVALLIYTDPADDGYTHGDVYPEGPMRPPQGVQRGSILNVDGDPSTPGYASVPGAPRLEPSQMPLSHIPVVPIGYGNAAKFLGDVRGTGMIAVPGASQPLPAPLPQSWQGGLPFRYHIGPGPARARVTYDAEYGQSGYHTIWDPMGIIRGTEYPDEMLIAGGHRDAWGPGAADNVSGTVSILEIAHAVAEAAREGHPPKRTIVFALWDAEEWGLVGSTEYVEDDSARLTRDAVMYLNLDEAASGPNFHAGGSPSLREALRDIVHMIPQPGTGPNAAPETDRSVWDAWQSTAMGSDNLGPRFGDPGGGSDFSGFANHLGIPILEFGFGGPGGVYHSAYDDFAWESRFGDPGFVHHAGAARIGAALLLRLADADILPYDYVEFARTMRRYATAVDESIRSKGWSISSTALATSIDGMERAAAAFSATRDSALGTTVDRTAQHQATTAPGGGPARPHGSPAGGWTVPAKSALAEANAALIRVERALTRPNGLQGRPWFRSLIYAADADNGYANITFPSISEAIRAGDRALTAREITDLASRFDAATADLNDATEALRKAR